MSKRFSAKDEFGHIIFKVDDEDKVYAYDPETLQWVHITFLKGEEALLDLYNENEAQAEIWIRELKETDEVEGF